MVPVIVRVYGDEGDGAPSTDVPVTPDTTWRDVIECCRDPGDEDCELVGIWAGRCEKALREGDRPLEILQRWGSGRDSVKLMLRYTPLSSEAPPATPNNNNGGRINSRNGMKEPGYLEETLPDGVQLTLGELREMAHRQQHQIDAQHQLLAAKEQRLRHLKEQEARHQRVATENERLRRLRDRVEAQELKLRKLRALRGQVDQNKQNNVLLTSDLDSIRALFNEKEKELSVAVAKVDELTRQLEELRRGRASRDQPPSAATLELEKLRRELMYRNKLNEQQNARLHQQREALTQRQEEMSNIDKRILELQDRLQRKRIMNRQLDTQLTTVPTKGAPLHGSQSGSAQVGHHPLTKQYSKGNVAAIEPYNHVPLMNHDDDKSSSVDKRLITGSAYYPSGVTNQSKNISDFNNLKNQNKEDYQGLKNKQSNSNIPKNDLNNDYITEFGASKSDPKYQTLPYNTKFSVNFMTTKTNRESTTDSEKLNADSGETPQSNGSKNAGYQHMTVHSTPLSTVNKSLAIPLSQNDANQEKQAAQKPNDQKNGDIGSRLSGPGRGQPVGEPSTNISTPTNVNVQKPISSVAPTSVHHASNKPSPIYQTSSTKIQPVQPQIIKTSVQTSTPTSSQVVSNQVVVLSPPNSSSTPITSPEMTSDKSKPVLPPKPAIKPPPRQTQPSTADYEPKDGTEALVPPIPKSEPPLESPPIHRYDNKPIKARPLTIKKQPLSEQPKLRNVSKLNGVHVSINRRIEMPPAFLFPEMETPPSDLINNENNKQIANNNNDSKNAVRSSDEVDKCVTNEEKSVVADLNRENKKNACESSSNDTKIDSVVRRANKGNLKQSGKVNLSRRVSFDPLALLLDASLEGELELVKKTATQVANPSAANDEGITALHNAICAGHLEIVKFLVEFGCDVNAQDSDGWTPLHCAASCNNVAMVRFLVEHGACIFATTLSDHETAAEKCEEDEEGFDGCSEYLYSVQEKLGILYGGIVYAVFDYVAQQPDELSFTAGQQLTVIRKGDENEREWWWARLGDREGYVPRNLLGLYPRVVSKSE